MLLDDAIGKEIIRRFEARFGVQGFNIGVQKRSLSSEASICDAARRLAIASQTAGASEPLLLAISGDLVLVGLPPPPTPPPGPPPITFSLGFLSVLDDSTTSGKLKALIARSTVEAAVQRASDVLGVHVDLNVKNVAASATAASIAATAREFTTENVRVVVGTLDSTQTLALIDAGLTRNDSGTLFISATSTSGEELFAQDDLLLRMAANDRTASKVVAGELARLGVRCLASVAVDNSYGRFLSNEVRAQFSARFGGVLIGDAPMYVEPDVRHRNVFDINVIDKLIAEFTGNVDDDEALEMYLLNVFNELVEKLSDPLVELLARIDAALTNGQCIDRSQIGVHIVAAADTATVLQEMLFAFGPDVGDMKFIGADGEIFDPQLVTLTDARTFATMYVLIWLNLLALSRVL